jgi:hypothetical protein
MGERIRRPNRTPGSDHLPDRLAGCEASFASLICFYFYGRCYSDEISPICGFLLISLLASARARVGSGNAASLLM